MMKSPSKFKKRLCFLCFGGGEYNNSKFYLKKWKAGPKDFSDKKH